MPAFFFGSDRCDENRLGVFSREDFKSYGQLKSSASQAPESILLERCAERAPCSRHRVRWTGGCSFAGFDRDGAGIQATRGLGSMEESFV